jgi:tetratricopeptide (TPR) repeat protein
MKKLLTSLLLISSLFTFAQTASEWNRKGLDEKDIDKKIEYFTKAINLNPDNQTYRYNRAVQYYKKNDNQNALVDFNTVLKHLPNDELSYFHRGRVYNDLEDYTKALADLKKATDLKPNDYTNWYWLGIVNYNAGNYQQSIESQNKAIELKPDFALSYNSKGLNYKVLKDNENAIQNYSKAINLQPDNQIYWYNRATLYWEMKEFQKAISDCNKAISIDNRFAEAYNLRALSKQGIGDLSGAKLDFEKAISLLPDDWRYYNNLGVNYFESNDYQTAFDFFMIAKNLINKDDKRYSWVFNKLAESSIYLKKYPEAEKYATQSIQIDPKNYTPYRNRAHARLLLGRLDEAMSDIGKSLELVPTYNKSYYTRGLIYEQKKQYQLALNDFKEAMKLANSFQLVYKESDLALKRVEKLVGASEPPVIVLTSPIEKKSRGFTVVEANDINSSEKIISIQGKVNSTNGIFEILINGAEPEVDSEGYFEHKLPLAYGKNTIVVKATDMKKQSSELSFVINRTNEVKKQIKTETVKTAGKYYALIIGVNDYDHPQVNDLDKPFDDANLLKNTLLSHYAFNNEDVRLIKNPDRAQIYKELDDLSKKVGPSDNLLIFYAGHGYWDEQFKKGYWLLKDAAPENRASWFSNSDLKDYIGAINSKHTLLIADACFGGAIFKERDAFSNANMEIKMLYESRSRKAMTSGALKTVPDESAFFKYLIKRLEENNETYLPSEELFSSFKRAVMLNSDNIPQYGDIHGTGGEGGDFIFIRR